QQVLAFGSGSVKGPMSVMLSGPRVQSPHMSAGSELSDDHRQNPPGQSPEVLDTCAARLPPIQADDSAHVSPATTQSRSLAHRSDEPVRLAFWQLWSELSAGSRVPSGRMTNVDPARSAKKTGSEANVGALPPMPWVQR